MKLVRCASLVLGASLALSAGCASSGHHGESRASRNAVRNETGLLRIPYELPKSAAHLSLVLTLHASEGSFAYSLVDPHGTPLWQGRVTRGQDLSESRAFKAVPGKWVLNLTMEDATGRYDATWKSD
jgi:hypothetical protein